MTKRTIDPKRSANMRAVKSENTVPEMQVRRFVHRLGYRFRLHYKSLPGKPDMVFPRLRSAIFVQGCFWHGHDCPRGARLPKTNVDYWSQKIARNKDRDCRNLDILRSLGWKVLTIWECELRGNQQATEGKIADFLCGAIPGAPESRRCT